MRGRQFEDVSTPLTSQKVPFVLARVYVTQHMTIAWGSCGSSTGPAVASESFHAFYQIQITESQQKLPGLACGHVLQQIHRNVERLASGGFSSAWVLYC